MKTDNFQNGSNDDDDEQGFFSTFKNRKKFVL